MNKIIRKAILIAAFGTAPVFASAAPIASTHGRISSSTIQNMQYYGSENSFVSAWNEARVITPWNGGQASSSTTTNSMPSSSRMTNTSCPLSPRIGFNQDNDLPNC